MSTIPIMNTVAWMCMSKMRIRFHSSGSSSPRCPRCIAPHLHPSSTDSKGVISRVVENEIARLCREDGLRVVSRKGMAHLVMEEAHPIE